MCGCMIHTRWCHSLLSATSSQHAPHEQLPDMRRKMQRWEPQNPRVNPKGVEKRVQMELNWIKTCKLRFFYGGGPSPGGIELCDDEPPPKTAVYVRRESKWVPDPCASIASNSQFHLVSVLRYCFDIIQFHKTDYLWKMMNGQMQEWKRIFQRFFFITLCRQV